MNSRTLDAWLLRRAPLCLALTFTLMLWRPRGARALDDRTLSYRAPPECPDRGELERGVEA
jgi:hypothetical protein